MGLFPHVPGGVPARWLSSDRVPSGGTVLDLKASSWLLRNSCGGGGGGASALSSEIERSLLQVVKQRESVFVDEGLHRGEARVKADSGAPPGAPASPCPSTQPVRRSGAPAGSRNVGAPRLGTRAAFSTLPRPPERCDLIVLNPRG